MVVFLLTIAVFSAHFHGQYIQEPKQKPSAANQDREPGKTRESLATLVYDARLREFRCWSEGALEKDFRRHLCEAGAGWHPLNANLYFVRGQSINVVLTNAVAEDIFTLDIKTDDLAEPQVPVSGGLSELPKLQPIPAPPAVLAGLGAAFVAGTTPIRASAAWRLAVTAEEKEFKAWIQANIIEPFNSKEVLDLLAADVDAAIQQATSGDAILTELQAVRKRVTDIHDDPHGMDDWINGVRTLVSVIDKQSSLKSRLVVTGVTAAGATINAALVASRSGAAQRALAVDPADLALFANALSTGLGETPSAHINAVTVMNRTFHSDDPSMTPIIEGLNNALGGVDAATVLARAKTNLEVLADAGPQIQLADTRRQALAGLKTKIDAQQQSTTSGVYVLQREWTATAALIVTKAAALNAAAKSLPLEGPFDMLPIGQWFSSRTVTVTVKQGQRVPLFDVGGVADASRAGIAGGETPASKGTQTAAADLSAARVLQFPIYNLYRFKIGLGFLYSTGDDRIFKVDKVTTGSGATAVTQQFIDQTRDRDYSILGSVNLMIFPWARHAFPWRPRYDGEGKPGPYKDLAAMIGFSVSNPNRDFVFGGAWFPRMSPVGVQLAWHLGLRDYPQPGSDPARPIADRVIALQQTRINGLAAGLVFASDFFSKVFAPIFKP